MPISLTSNPPTSDPTGFGPVARDEIQSPLYTDGSAAVDEYRFEPGVCVLPVAEDPPTNPDDLKNWSPVVVLRLHAPYRVRKAGGRAFKQNNPPVVPAPLDTGAFVFVGGTMTVHNVVNQTLLNYDWTVTTAYVFVEDCVSRVEDGFVLGSAPWTWPSTVANAATYPGTPQFGAVAQAGKDAQAGYFQAIAQLPNLNQTWAYNCPTFYPGVFMNTQMVNAGPPFAPLPVG